MKQFNGYFFVDRNSIDDLSKKLEEYDILKNIMKPNPLVSECIGKIEEILKVNHRAFSELADCKISGLDSERILYLFHEKIPLQLNEAIGKINYFAQNIRLLLNAMRESTRFVNRLASCILYVSAGNENLEIIKNKLYAEVTKASDYHGKIKKLIVESTVKVKKIVEISTTMNTYINGLFVTKSTSQLTPDDELITDTAYLAEVQVVMLSQATELINSINDEAIRELFHSILVNLDEMGKSQQTLKESIITLSIITSPTSTTSSSLRTHSRSTASSSRVPF